MTVAPSVTIKKITAKLVAGRLSFYVYLRLFNNRAANAMSNVQNAKSVS